MSTQGAKLLLEVSERVRTLTQAYFSPERPLHLSFTHLVCRTAIKGNCHPPLFLSASGPCGGCIASAPPNCVGSSSLLKDGLPCPRLGLASLLSCDPQASG